MSVATPEMVSPASLNPKSGNSARDALLAAMRPYAEENRTKTWRLTLSTLSLIGFALWLSLPPFSMFLRVPASLALSLLMVRVFILFHDYMHGAIFRNSRAGKILMSIVGTLMLRPPADWRRSHNFHHAHNTQFATANVGSFPIKTVDQYAALSEKRKKLYRVVRSPLVIIFGYLTCFIMEGFNKLRFWKEGLTLQAIAALGLHFSLMYLAARAGTSVLILSFFVPYFVSCAVGTYLFYMQHNFEGALFKPDEDWDFEFAALNSSSCLRCGPVTHWFTGNIGYHHIHHLNHKIPFYRLPEAMKAISELQNPVFVDLKPSTIYRTLNLKLWDESESRMITFKEFARQSQASLQPLSS